METDIQKSARKWQEPYTEVEATESNRGFWWEGLPCRKGKWDGSGSPVSAVDGQESPMVPIGSIHSVELNSPEQQFYSRERVHAGLTQAPNPSY